MYFLLLVLFCVSISNAVEFIPQEKSSILNRHNLERAKYCLPPLVWDEQLAQTSSDYAAKCIFGHSGQIGVGENLYGSTYPHLNPVASVVSWANEKNLWECGFCCDEETGHFTQIVWNETQSVGCGMAFCQYEGTVLSWIVCQYSPPGNGRREPFPTKYCDGNCLSNITTTESSIMGTSTIESSTIESSITSASSKLSSTFSNIVSNVMSSFIESESESEYGTLEVIILEPYNRTDTSTLEMTESESNEEIVEINMEMVDKRLAEWVFILLICLGVLLFGILFFTIIYYSGDNDIYNDIYNDCLA